MGSLNFNAEEHVPNNSFEPIPPGTYACTVVEAEWVESDSAGRGIKLKLEVDANVHPEIGNRSIFDRLWINHPSPAKPGKRSTAQIAISSLSSLCHASGRMQLDEPDDLLGAEVAVKVKIKPATEQYEAGNDVVAYKPVDKATGAIAAATKAAKPTVAKANGGAAKPTAAAKAAPAGRKPWGAK
ncbi:MAG: DUF669 domain-containing protein [Planctomycetes bacterium]|nr:DUF669 domain-containing protein [Planctomycetota bacterium]